MSIQFRNVPELRYNCIYGVHLRRIQIQRVMYWEAIFFQFCILNFSLAPIMTWWSSFLTLYFYYSKLFSDMFQLRLDYLDQWRALISSSKYNCMLELFCNTLNPPKLFSVIRGISIKKNVVWNVTHQTNMLNISGQDEHICEGPLTRKEYNNSTVRLHFQIKHHLQEYFTTGGSLLQ